MFLPKNIPNSNVFRLLAFFFWTLRFHRRYLAKDLMKSYPLHSYLLLLLKFKIVFSPSSLTCHGRVEAAMKELEERLEGLFKLMIQARASRPLHLRSSFLPLHLRLQ